MKKVFLQYKPFFIFLFRFFVLYVVLTVGYKVYLNQFDADRLEVDGFTHLVAQQSADVLNFLGNEAEIENSRHEPCFNLIYKGRFIARIIEGCNALSVMILFAAFVFAFSSRWLYTFLYIGVGCVIIHVFNIFRIALLAVALYDYPEYEHLLHGVLFPLVIYGLVFMLWVLWVQKFSGYAEKNTEK